ncbi:unnamed protein product, partial [Brenthis ino]
MKSNDFMIIKKIPKDHQSLLSASVYINSYKRAIEELVFNSLDAESNSIAIRVNIQENFIQVLDNGSGIAKHNFALLGNKYTSSKYLDITTLKSAPDKYGYRGITLASIIEISQMVKISSKFHTSNKTWMKTFSNGKEVDFSICVTRPSSGTTVEIFGFLYNLVIQHKSIDPLKELQYIKLGLEQLSLVHCNVSISLRDDSKNEIIFKVNKNRDIYQTLKSLFGIQQHDVQDLQVEKKQYKPVNIYKGTNKAEDNENSSTRKKVKEIMEKILNKNTYKPKISQLKKGIKGKNVKRKRKTDILLHDVINIKKMNKLNNVIDLSKVVDPKRKITIENHENKIITNINAKSIKVSNGNKSQNKMKTKNVEQQTIPKKLKKNKQKYIKNRYDESLHKPKRIKHKKIFKKDSDQSVKYKNVYDKNIFKKINLPYVEDILENNDIVKYERDFKTSYDLIKPITDYVSPVMPKKQHFVVQQQTQSCKEIDFTTCETLISKSTFKSHNYHQNFELKKNVMKEFISTNSRKNFLLHEHKLNPIHKNRMKYKENNKKISKNTLEILNESAHVPSNTNELKSNERTICSNINTPQDNKYFTDTFHIDKESRSREISKDNKYTYSTDFNYANTYTIDVLSSSLFTNNSKFSNTYSIQKYNYSTYRTQCRKSPISPNQNEKFDFSKSHSYRKDNIIISDSQTLEPLNYCETMFHTNNLDDIEKEFNTSFLNKDVIEENLLDRNKANDSLLNNGLIEDFNSIDFAFNEDFNKIELNFMEFDANRNIDDQVITNMDEKDNCINKNTVKVNTVENDKVIENTIGIDSENMDNFKLKGRHSFVPKGMSQIFNINSNININSKTSRPYDDQQEYYEDDIYQNFAKDVLGNFKIYEPDVENVKDTVTKHIKKASDKFNKDNTNLMFNATSLKHATVLGQVDRKFIVAIVQGRTSKNGKFSNFLVLFDQHAVDERVRLETNLKDYYNGNEWKSASIDSVIRYKLNKDDYFYLYNQKEKFYHFGLRWTFADNEILIHAIPTAILGKNIRDVEIVIKAVKKLISEQIELIKLLKGNVSSYPKSIMNLVFSEACRYAIKFGDKLSKNDCVNMINALSECKTPFQCAHGRPVIAVLLELVDNKTKYTINLNKIKKFISFL